MPSAAPVLFKDVCLYVTYQFGDMAGLFMITKRIQEYTVIIVMNGLAMAIDTVDDKIQFMK